MKQATDTKTLDMLPVPAKRGRKPSGVPKSERIAQNMREYRKRLKERSLTFDRVFQQAFFHAECHLNQRKRDGFAPCFDRALGAYQLWYDLAEVFEDSRFDEFDRKFRDLLFPISARMSLSEIEKVLEESNALLLSAGFE